MISSITDTATLNNGVAMPRFGLGVWAVGGDEVERVARMALEIGYRSIDTAAIYNNEEGVGRAVRACGLPREQVFVTTKLWNADQGYDAALKAFDKSLDRLGLEYVDLYLIHWPVAGKSMESWRALEAIYDSGRARAIGVSNFKNHHIEELLEEARVTPAVNQMEFHPYLQIPECVAFCADQGIQFESWRPLMYGKVLQVPALVRIGKKHGKTAAQVTLRWLLQRGIVAIPKSVRRERLVENAAIFDFALDEDDMAAIDALDRNQRLGADPDDFHF